MSSATILPSTARDPHGELRDELCHVRDLVFLRDLFRERGAAPTELRLCDAVIAEARTRLAESAKLALPYFPAAA